MDFDNTITEYRITLPKRYPLGSSGHGDLSARCSFRHRPSGRGKSELITFLVGLGQSEGEDLFDVECDAKPERSPIRVRLVGQLALVSHANGTGQWYKYTPGLGWELTS